MRWADSRSPVYPGESSENTGRDVQILLVAMVPLLVTGPAIPPGTGNLPVISLFLTVMMAGALPVLRDMHRQFLVGCITALVSLEFFWMSGFSGNPILFVLGELSYLLFLMVLTRHLLVRTARCSGPVLALFFLLLSVVISSGICLGTVIHLSSLLEGASPPDASTMAVTFCERILDGVTVMTPAGGFVSTGIHSGFPLTRILYTFGTLGGYGILLLSVWRIVLLKKE